MSFAATKARKLVWSLAAIYWLSIFTATHLPPTRLPQTHVSDKLEHFTAYAILSGILCICMWIGRPTARLARTVAIVVVIVLVYGAIDERTQPFFNRTCSLDDWIADALGAICGALLAVLLWRRFVLRTAP